MSRRYPNDIQDPITDHRNRSGGRALLIALICMATMYLIAIMDWL